MDNINKELFENKHISDKQFRFLEAIRTKKIVSVYYELRLMLYLGILLFTGGVGYYAYQNMSEIGHFLSMALLGLAIIIGFFFIQKHAQPYTNAEVIDNHIYLDYILILVSLLIISLFTYVQVYFDLVALLVHWTSFISAAILFFMAYRYDNKALLSMAIVAFAAALGITITPVDWQKGDWMATTDLYLLYIFFGILLIGFEQISNAKGIKKHFRFTYQNFGLLLFFMGCISATFDSNYKILFASILLITAIALAYYTWMKKEFLFFLYSNIAGYIAFTYLFIELIQGADEAMLLIYYFPITCIGYIVFLVKKKSHFTNE